MANTKTISSNTNLQALGLFTLARSHYKKYREYESALGELLGIEDTSYLGCISDEIYDNGNFAAGMQKENFVVAKPKPKPKAKPR